MRQHLAFLIAAMMFEPCMAAPPERTVVGNAVISRRDPAVTVQLPKTAHYVGADRFLLRDPKLGDFDDCELHAFVEADKGGDVRKLYWVQFESYLPNHPELHHAYDSPRRTVLGGLDFYVDTWTVAGGSKPDPGSDSEHFHALLGAHGIKRRDMMAVRFVHLADTAKRKELMIIYREAVPQGLTAVALQKGGEAYGQWPALEQGLIARAKKAITVQPSGG